MQNLLEIKNLYKSYGSNRLFNNFNLSIGYGEMTAICGDSGSGKTTLLNIISMLVKADKGDVYLDNRKLKYSNKKENARIRNQVIGYIFQDYRLINEMSVIDNIGIPAIIAGKPDWEKKSRYYLEVFNIDKFKETSVKKLSGGQKQRVAIARALIMNPKLILADEPTGALDKKNRDLILHIFVKLKAAGKSIIIVTHDEDVASCCDNIIYL